MDMNDPRAPQPDELAVAIAALDQHVAQAEHVGRLLHAEWLACVEAGVPPIAAAVMIGQRWNAAA